MGGSEAQFQLQAEIELAQMKKVQAYVGIRGALNSSELADVPVRPDGALHADSSARPVHLDYRVNHTRWVVLRYPTPSMAQLASMSTEQFEELLLPGLHARLRAAWPRRWSRSRQRMERTDRVRVTRPRAPTSASASRTSAWSRARAGATFPTASASPRRCGTR